MKFGVPLVDVCSVHNDLPSLLLMMILKMNKEAPYKKDVFRAPGNHANMRKLMKFLQVKFFNFFKKRNKNPLNFLPLEWTISKSGTIFRTYDRICTEEISSKITEWHFWPTK